MPDAEKTIALGGVATGSMKAKLQVTVAGIIRYRGLVPKQMLVKVFSFYFFLSFF